MAQSCDRDGGAAREVARVYELVKQLQAVVRRDGEAPGLAESLLREALQALNVALSIMRPPPAVKAEQRGFAADTSGSPARCGGRAAVKPEEGEWREQSIMRGKRRRTEDNSWIDMTTMPHDDGYQWRKYGEKKISGICFARSYFRCTYKDDQGCLATKQIQQKDFKDPPLFQVTYTNEHNCNAITHDHNSAAFQTLPNPNFAASHGIIKKEAAASCISNSSDGIDGSMPVLRESDVEQMMMELLGFEHGGVVCSYQERSYIQFGGTRAPPNFCVTQKKKKLPSSSATPLRVRRKKTSTGACASPRRADDGRCLISPTLPQSLAARAVVPRGLTATPHLQLFLSLHRSFRLPLKARRVAGCR